MHCNAIITEDGLVASATSKDFLLVRHEGKRVVERNVPHYNLDIIMRIHQYSSTHPAKKSARR